MGYVCPVCAEPQADGEHLANHLAFTAMLGDDDHESWLDEHVPDWGQSNPADLAPKVTEYATETAMPEGLEEPPAGGDTGQVSGSPGGAGSDEHNQAQDHGHVHAQGNAHSHTHDCHTDDGDAQQSTVDDAAVPESGDPGDVFDDDREIDTEDVLAEARELTRQRRANAADAKSSDGEQADDEGQDGDDGGSGTGESADGTADDTADDA